MLAIGDSGQRLYASRARERCRHLAASPEPRLPRRAITIVTLSGWPDQKRACGRSVVASVLVQCRKDAQFARI
jgi:hypothetical protein